MMIKGFFFIRDEKSNKVVRMVKTLYVLMSMGISFLIFSAPLLLVVADTLLPSALLSASMSPNSLTLNAMSSLLAEYDFRVSLLDVPVVSVIRSAVIIIVYSLCDGPKLCRGPYMAMTTMLSTVSLMFVSVKVVFLLRKGASGVDKGAYSRAMEVALVVSSLGLAFGHIIVAYRITCRERRKLLLVYRMDIEAVSGGKIGFSRYKKLLQEERFK